MSRLPPFWLGKPLEVCARIGQPDCQVADSFCPLTEPQLVSVQLRLSDPPNLIVLSRIAPAMSGEPEKSRQRVLSPPPPEGAARRKD